MNLRILFLSLAVLVSGLTNGQESYKTRSYEWNAEKERAWDILRTEFPEYTSTDWALKATYAWIQQWDAWAKVNDPELYDNPMKPLIYARRQKTAEIDSAAKMEQQSAAEEERRKALAQEAASHRQANVQEPQQVILTQSSTSGNSGRGGQTGPDMSAVWLGRAIILVATLSIAWGLHWISKKKRGEIHSLLPASFGIRLGAHIIDFFVTSILGFMVGFVIGYMLEGLPPPETILWVAAIAGGVSSWLYYAIMESSSKQATLGKMACGLLVTNFQGERIGFGQASGRYVSKIVSSLTLFIGFIMCAWTKNRQCLHDMMAGCLVLDDGRSSGAIIALTPPMRAPASPAFSPPPLTEALAVNAQKDSVKIIPEVLASDQLSISQDAKNKAQRLPLIMNNIKFEVEIPEGVKLENGYVEMRHNTQYSLILKNHPWVPCDAEVVIDGIHVGTWRIESRGEIRIERPVHDTGHFTFFQVWTEEAEIAGITKHPDNGLISVTFKPQKEVESLKTATLSPSVSAGATGLTGESQQRFREASEIEHDMSRAFTIHIRLISKQLNIRPLAPRSTPIPPPVG